MGDLFRPFCPYVENFLGLSTVRFTKISVGAHGFATNRVVPNMSLKLVKHSHYICLPEFKRNWETYRAATTFRSRFLYNVEKINEVKRC